MLLGLRRRLEASLVDAFARRELEQKSQEVSQNSFEGTYFVSGIAFERAVIDLHIGIISRNSSALKVACPAPGIAAKF